MDLKMKTFEDLIGNFADDAKKALDEILDRESATKNGTPPETAEVAAVGGTLAGLAAEAVGSLTTTISDLKKMLGGLVSLPEQVAKLSALIEQLLPLINALTTILGAAGNVAGAAGKVNPTKR